MSDDVKKERDERKREAKVQREAKVLVDERKER
jgi:hypothetical protein